MAPREWALQDEPNAHGWEPAIAAGDDIAIAVYYDSASQSFMYMIFDPNVAGGSWVAQGVIPHDPFDPNDPNDPNDDIPLPLDPSIAYNRDTGQFLAAAFDYHDGRVGVSRFVPNSNAPNGYGEFEPWRKVYDDIDFQQPNIRIDKTWIVAGEVTDSGQEFYIAYWKLDLSLGSVGVYGRSVDGGETWVFDNMRYADDPSELVSVAFCFQPAVWQDRPMYGVTRSGGPEPGAPKNIYFVKGIDLPALQPLGMAMGGYQWPAGGMKFKELMAPEQGGEQQRVQFQINRIDQIKDALPGSFEAGLVPQLAADPADPNRLYTAYHFREADEKDVNVYMRVLTRQVDDSWVLGDAIKVNNDSDPTGDHDQFLPQMVVDDEGYVHLTFYDDRRFTQADKQINPPPKFDMYYAWAPLDDLTFSDPERNMRMYLNDPNDPNDPAELDQADTPPYPYLDPHEYNGLTWFGDTILTTCTGSDSAIQAPNKTMIWSTRIDWTWQQP